MVMDRDHVERSVTIVGNGCWIMVIIGVIVLKHMLKRNYSPLRIKAETVTFP